MDRDTLEKHIESFEKILKLNPENPAVRVKLAELIGEAGRAEESDMHWARAATDFFKRREYNPGIEILEGLVSRNPDNARLRKRLSRAILKRQFNRPWEDEGDGLGARL